MLLKIREDKYGHVLQIRKLLLKPSRKTKSTGIRYHHLRYFPRLLDYSHKVHSIVIYELLFAIDLPPASAV